MKAILKWLTLPQYCAVECWLLLVSSLLATSSFLFLTPINRRHVTKRFDLILKGQLRIVLLEAKKVKPPKELSGAKRIKRSKWTPQKQANPVYYLSFLTPFLVAKLSETEQQLGLDCRYVLSLPLKSKTQKIFFVVLNVGPVSPLMDSCCNDCSPWVDSQTHQALFGKSKYLIVLMWTREPLQPV